MASSQTTTQTADATAVTEADPDSNPVEVGDRSIPLFFRRFHSSSTVPQSLQKTPFPNKGGGLPSMEEAGVKHCDNDGIDEPEADNDDDNIVTPSTHSNSSHSSSKQDVEEMATSNNENNAMQFFGMFRRGFQNKNDQQEGNTDNGDAENEMVVKEVEDYGVSENQEKSDGIEADLKDIEDRAQEQSATAIEEEATILERRKENDAALLAVRERIYAPRRSNTSHDPNNAARSSSSQEIKEEAINKITDAINIDNGNHDPIILPEDKIIVHLEALLKNQQFSSRRLSSSSSPINHSLVKDFETAIDRESFQRRISTSNSTREWQQQGGDNNSVTNDEPEATVDWPSPVSSLGSPHMLKPNCVLAETMMAKMTIGGANAAAAKDAREILTPTLPFSDAPDNGGHCNVVDSSEEKANVDHVSSKNGKYNEDDEAASETKSKSLLPKTAVPLRSNERNPNQPIGQQNHGSSVLPQDNIIAIPSQKPTPDLVQQLKSETYHDEDRSIDPFNDLDCLNVGDKDDNDHKLSNEQSVDWGDDEAGSSCPKSSDERFDMALYSTQKSKRNLQDFKASLQSCESYSYIPSQKIDEKSSAEGGSRSSLSGSSFGGQQSLEELLQIYNAAKDGSLPEDNSIKSGHDKASSLASDSKSSKAASAIEDVVPSPSSLEGEEETVEEEVTAMQVMTKLSDEQEGGMASTWTMQVKTKLNDAIEGEPSSSSSIRSSSLQSRNRNSSKSVVSEVSSLGSLDSPVYLFSERVRRESENLESARRQSEVLESAKRQSEGPMRQRVDSDSSLSSLDSFASPTGQKSIAMRKVKPPPHVKTEITSEGGNNCSTDGNDIVDFSQGVNDFSHVDNDVPPQHISPRDRMVRNNPDKSNSFHRMDGRRNSDNRNSFKLERVGSDSSISVDDLCSVGVDSFQASGLANDVALHLEYSTKSMNTYYSTDGIDHIDPNATDEGRDDFDFAMKAYADAINHGHFDFHDNKAKKDENSGSSDQVLAARAYMGLGFTRQCKGELESSLDAYTKALILWKDEMGLNDSLTASIQYTIGTVLIEMQRQLEAADHFKKALHLFKCSKPAYGDNRASIVSTEGMLFSVLGEANRAIDCFRQVYQSSRQPKNLKLATVMFEIGSLLSQTGEYDDSANCFNFALEIRKAILGDSFVVARTNYSLGVTQASQELKANKNIASASHHLEEALRICQQEFEAEHLQSAIIVHALGVLNERKGDFLSASVWFANEHNMRKVLFGEDHETVASVSADLGTCYYNSGKYELAISTFEDGLRIILLAENDRSVEVAEALYKIASCHDSLCNYDEALEKFHEVKKIRESLFGVESSPVIQSMLRIGNIQLCKGEVKQALDTFTEVLGIGYASDSVNAVEVANALYGRGCAQFCGFHLADAMKSFSESLNWKLAALGEDAPGLACIFYQMAHVYLEQSEPDEAITCFEEFARLQKLETQRNLHDNAEICYAEGIVAKLKGMQDAALSFYNQALAMFDTLFGGGDHEKIASIHFDIGCVHSTMGNFEAALSHFHTCLLQRRKLLGGHVDVANALYEMGSIYIQQDRIQLAAKCLTESDRIWKAKLKNNEKLTSVLLLSAKLWKSLQCYQSAEENFEQALEQAISIYGQKHESVASILLSLGELLQEINQIQQALFCFDESIQVRTALYGLDSPSVAQVEYSKGVALLFHGEFEDASNCLNRALIIRQAKLGPKDGAVGDTLNTIGFLQLRMGNISGQEALDPLTKALEIRRAIDNKSKVVSTLQNIASVYKKRKQIDSCMETHVEILGVRQEEFGPNDARVADAWISLGNIQASAGRLVEATLSYEEALRIQTLANGYNHISVARVLFKIGSINSRQNNYTVAKQLFEEYMRIRAEEEADPDEEMAQALTLTGDLQKASGEKSKAQINWTSALEIYQQLGYPENHPKLSKLRARQRTVPSFGFSSSSRKSASDFSVFSGISFFGGASTQGD